MNINYIGQILTTTSLIFETVCGNKRQCFFVKAGDNINLTADSLTFNDYIEDKEYILDHNVTFSRLCAKGDVIPSYIESATYNDYIQSNKDQIINNNKRFIEWFDELKEYYPFVDRDEENLYTFKTQTDTRTIMCMKSFGVTDLLGYINQTPKILSQIKDNCYIFLKGRADQAIKELELERAKFIIEQDQDSIEEIDIIIEMINETVNTTSFESIEELSDAAKLWPPILLPAPFFETPPIEICP
jgi:hypothetical protein